MAADAAVELLAPPLSQGEVVYLQSLQELAAGLLGVEAASLEEPPSPAALAALLTSPGQQLRELQAALAAVAGSPASRGAVGEVGAAVADGLMRSLAGRAGVDVDAMFPLRRALLSGGNIAGASASSGLDGAVGGRDRLAGSQGSGSSRRGSEADAHDQRPQAAAAAAGGSAASLRTPSGSSIKMRPLTPTASMDETAEANATVQVPVLAVR